MRKIAELLFTLTLIMLLGFNCRRNNSEPEELSKHLYGIVTDYFDGRIIPEGTVVLYELVFDGSLQIRYKGIAQADCDSNGYFEFKFISDQRKSYAVELVSCPGGYVNRGGRTNIPPEKERKKEIKMDLKASVSYYLKGFYSLRAVGDSGNDKCILNHEGIDREILKGQDVILCIGKPYTNNVNIKYRIEKNNITIKDTSYFIRPIINDTNIVNIHF